MTSPASTVTTARARTAQVIRFRPGTAVALLVVSLVGLVAFAWPLFVHASTSSPNSAHSADAPWLFVLVLPLLMAVLLAELSSGGIDSKAIAVLGVLIACGAALRLPGTGITGFTPVFFLLIPAGRVFGRGFGLVLGALTLFVSALLTSGVGPWLPFQMFGAAWVGFFAGCLPPARGKAELLLLGAYGAVAGLAFGLLLDLWFWPFTTAGLSSSVRFVAGDPLAENLRRFWAFHLASGLGFDIPRAVGNFVLVVLAGHPVLSALRRASRKAVFDARPTFAETPITGAATRPPDSLSGPVMRGRPGR